MYGYIYLTTNNVNGKKYIGQHRFDGFDSEYYGSGTIFSKALKKYGKHNFIVEVLCQCQTEEELNQREIEYIEKFNAVCSEDFYNVSFGGYKSGPRGLKSMYNPDLDKVIYVPEKTMRTYIDRGFRPGNRPRSNESKDRYRKGREDLVTVTDGVVTKYVHSIEVDSYIDNGWRKGRITTRPNQKEEKRKWMNKDGVSIMVKQDDIQKFIDEGYEFGRVKFSKFQRKASAHNKGKKQVVIDGHLKYV